MRLTNYWRDTVIQNALVATFDKDEKVLLEEEKDIGDIIYGMMIPDNVKPKLNDLPSGWFRSISGTEINISGYRLEIKFSEPKIFPADWPTWQWTSTSDHSEATKSIKRSILNDDLRDKVLDLKKRKEALKEKRLKLRQYLKSLLYSVNTDKKLSEVWPEGKKFYSTVDTNTTIGYLPPAVKIDEINEMLGIKKQES